MSFGCGVVWEKMGFSCKICFKRFCEISDFGENWIKLIWDGKVRFYCRM